MPLIIFPVSFVHGLYRYYLSPWQDRDVEGSKPASNYTVFMLSSTGLKLAKSCTEREERTSGKLPTSLKHYDRADRCEEAVPNNPFACRLAFSVPTR